MICPNCGYDLAEDEAFERSIAAIRGARDRGTKISRDAGRATAAAIRSKDLSAVATVRIQPQVIDPYRPRS